jgi:molybdopterin molybdotransferase
VAVYRRLRVALFSTGDELLAPGSAWRPAGVFDANRPLLAALLAGMPVEVDDRGILGDDPGRIRAMIDTAGDYDLVIASGGASLGGGGSCRLATGCSGCPRLLEGGDAAGAAAGAGRLGP